jgi:pimeloyl-ACP methyl ester carboxylesterase
MKSSALRLLARLVAAAVMLYVLLAIGVVVVLSKPHRRFDASKNPGRHGIAYQDVRFPARGGDAQLAGWYVPHDSRRAALVLVHGKDGSRTNEQKGRNDEFMAMLHKLGFTLLALDLRGHGQSSDARFSFGVNESRDVLGGVDYLSEKGYARRQIGIHGVSMGAASVLMAAAQDPEIPAVIADCGYADFGRVLHREWTRRTHLPSLVMPASRVIAKLWLGNDMTEVRPIERVPQIKGQVLFIHAAEDRLIPPSDSQEMSAKLPGSLLWIQPGARHAAGFDADPEGYTRHVADFFTQSLRN